MLGSIRARCCANKRKTCNEFRIDALTFQSSRLCAVSPNFFISVTEKVPSFQVWYLCPCIAVRIGTVAMLSAMMLDVLRTLRRGLIDERRFLKSYFRWGPTIGCLQEISVCYRTNLTAHSVWRQKFEGRLEVDDGIRRNEERHRISAFCSQIRKARRRLEGDE